MTMLEDVRRGLLSMRNLLTVAIVQRRRAAIDGWVVRVLLEMEVGSHDPANLVVESLDGQAAVLDVDGYVAAEEGCTGTSAKGAWHVLSSLAVSRKGKE